MSIQESKPRNFWPARIIAATILLVIILSMVLFEYNAQQNSRKDLEDRFAVRASTSSVFLTSYVQHTLERQQELAKLRLGNPEVTHEEFLDFLDNFGFGPSVLLDSQGRVLDVAPNPDDKLIGKKIIEEYPHLKRAVNGEQTVSNVVPSAALKFPIVAFATPFESQAGTRVISGAFDLTTQPLGNYLKNALPFKNSKMYLLDANGNVIASSDEKSGSLRSLNPSLAKFGPDVLRGTYTNDDDKDVFFASASIEDTTWRIVLTVEKDILFEPVNGPSRIFPWVLIAILAILASTLTVLVVRSGERRIRLQDVAMIDLLTGINNSRGIKSQLNRLLSGSRRHEDDLTIFMIDIDDFRKFNEKYGHNVGDEIIVNVAKQIQSRLRTEDIVGRWGGEEFVVILPYTDEAGASIVAERICRGVEEEVRSITENDAKVTVSIGLASIQKDDTVEKIVERADSSLKQAKQSGKNKISSSDK